MPVASWAHARRYFFKALSSEPDNAKVALDLIGKLFHIERELADQSRKKKEQVRKQRAGAIVKTFFDWCSRQRDIALDHTPIAKALTYALNQQKGLSRFLVDGRLPIHNNMSELQLRRQAVGRKNWLFIGSEDGGNANVVFVSLLASCRMHGIAPWPYLRDVLILSPSWPADQMLDLSPLNWAETSARPDVIATLEAHPFRRATTAPSP